MGRLRVVTLLDSMLGRSVGVKLEINFARQRASYPPRIHKAESC